MLSTETPGERLSQSCTLKRPCYSNVSEGTNRALFQYNHFHCCFVRLFVLVVVVFILLSLLLFFFSLKHQEKNSDRDVSSKDHGFSVASVEQK